MAKEKPQRQDSINQAIKLLDEQKDKILNNDKLTIELVKISDIKELKLKNDLFMHNRISYSKSKLSELAFNINQLALENGGILGTGLLNPVMLRRQNGNLERIHGDNRIKAMKLNNSEYIPAIILENVSDELARFMRTSENLKREDLNAYDETLSILEHIQLSCNFKDIDSVKSFINKIKNFQQNKTSLTDEEKQLYILVSDVFNRVGRFDIITFVDRLSVLKLNPFIKQALVDEKIGYSQAKVINSKLTTEEEILKILKILEAKNFSVSELKIYIKNMKELTSSETNKDNIFDELKKLNINKKKYDKLSIQDQQFINEKLQAIFTIYKSIEEKIK